MKTMKSMKIIGAFVLSLLFTPLFQSPLMGRDEPPRNAESTAQDLFQAYKSCNRAQALKVASRAAVNKLFRRCKPGDADNLKFMGCEKTGKSYLCSYYYEGGAMNMRVVRYGSGYRVASVGYIAD